MVSLEQLREKLGPTAEGWSDEDLELARSVLMLIAEKALDTVEPSPVVDSNSYLRHEGSA